MRWPRCKTCGHIAQMHETNGKCEEDNCKCQKYEGSPVHVESYQRFWDENGPRLREHHPIKENLIRALERYVCDRVPPGDFLRACLSNDFKEALGRADDDNRLNLYNIYIWICNAVPIIAQGSPDKVNKWVIGVEDQT